MIHYSRALEGSSRIKPGYMDEEKTPSGSSVGPCLQQENTLHLLLKEVPSLWKNTVGP